MVVPEHTADSKYSELSADSTVDFRQLGVVRQHRTAEYTHEYTGGHLRLPYYGVLSAPTLPKPTHSLVEAVFKQHGKRNH